MRLPTTLTSLGPRRSFAPLLLVGALTTLGSPAAAQTVPANPDPVEAAIATAAAEQAQVGPPVTLSYANRPILQLRASLVGRSAGERVAAGQLVLARLAEAGVTGPVVARPVGPAMSLDVAGQRVVAIFTADVDTLAGETPAEVAAAAARRLEVALSEVAELRRPRQLLQSGLLVLLATAVFVALIWALWWIRGRVIRRIDDATERRVRASKSGHAEFLRSVRVIGLLHRAVGALGWATAIFFFYSWLTFTLRRFPYTRPWGESMRSFLLGQLSDVGSAILDALPGLFTVSLIVLITRFVTRIMQLLFLSFEERRVTLPWMYPETAQPTRKLLTVALWAFAITIAYPYLPGANSDAFKGMSVFIGLVVSLGSSGIVNQVMSGFTLTYSRALRVGDFVTVGDVEGTVTQVGTLSTKIKTLKGEEVTIPNAVMVGQTVTNYSRFADSEGVYVPTSITIGYDVPWRQVQALMLLAAARTPGIRRVPAPFVQQASLEDAYVKHTLLFCPEQPALRRRTLAAVHANILDAFNEYGVQITSPNYEADPAAPKVVPRDQWFAAPAVAPEATESPKASQSPEAFELKI